MLHIRDVQGYPLQGINVVLQRPKPKNTLRDLVKLLQEAQQREEAANQCVKHWHHA